MSNKKQFKIGIDIGKGTDFTVTTPSTKRYNDFDTWWNEIGSGIRPFEQEDKEEFTKRVAFLAWNETNTHSKSEFMRIAEQAKKKEDSNNFKTVSLDTFPKQPIKIDPQDEFLMRSLGRYEQTITIKEAYERWGIILDRDEFSRKDGSTHIEMRKTANGVWHAKPHGYDSIKGIDQRLIYRVIV